MDCHWNGFVLLAVSCNLQLLTTGLCVSVFAPMSTVYLEHAFDHLGQSEVWPACNILYLSLLCQFVLKSWNQGKGLWTLIQYSRRKRQRHNHLQVQGSARVGKGRLGWRNWNMYKEESLVLYSSLELEEGREVVCMSGRSGSNHNTRTRTRTSLPLTPKLPNSQTRVVQYSTNTLQEPRGRCKKQLERNHTTSYRCVFCINNNWNDNNNWNNDNWNNNNLNHSKSQDDCQQLNHFLRGNNLLSTRDLWQLARLFKRLKNQQLAQAT